MKVGDNTGDRVLFGLCALAGVLAAVVLVEIVYQVIHGASPVDLAIRISFIWHSRWAANFGIFGAAAAIYGTVMTALMALSIATPLGIAIGLYLSMMAPPGVRAVSGRWSRCWPRSRA